MKQSTFLIGVAVVLALLALLAWLGAGRDEGVGRQSSGAVVVGSKSKERPMDPVGRGRGHDRSSSGKTTPGLTWDALRSSPVIEFGDGGRARVGVGSGSVPIGGGLLIYCLVEDGTHVIGVSGSRVALGPLECRIERPGMHAQVLDLLPEFREGLQLIRKGELLYAKSMKITEAGVHRVIITRQGSEDVVAEFVVHGVEEQFHPWFPFRRGVPIDRDDGGVHRDDVVRVSLAMADTGAALPKIDGRAPLVEGGGPSGAELPRLIPEAVDPGLTIRVAPGGFRLSSEQSMNLSHPQGSLLARWWVNGEPHIPDAKGARYPMMEGGRVLRGLTMDVALDFDPAAVGAETGDRIGLQLIHLPQGWTHVGDHAETLQQAFDLDGSSAPRVSNRIEFIAR